MPTYTTTIVQALPFQFTPVEQDLIIIVGCDLAVATEIGVKFCLRVSLIDGTRVGNFKTTPNNEGYGVFDVSSIVKNYVAADHEARKASNYKEYGAKGLNGFPIHLIDEYSVQTKLLRQMQFMAYTEYTDSTGVVVLTNPFTAGYLNVFNAYVKDTDKLSVELILSGSGMPVTTRGGFGYDTAAFLSTSTYDPLQKFLSNSPSIQWATRNDYGTMAFIAKWVGTGPGGGLENYVNAYTVYLIDKLDAQVSETKIINILCPTLKGYEPIRLGWMNQWGTWDYYTFNQKSIKTISTKGSTYNQLGGDWNKSTFQPKGYKGGKKSFRVNATEKIKMNTDYITEEHSEWFEELINSPEIYIIKGWEEPRHITSTNSVDSLNTYATPVRLTTKSFTKKTVANDKLIQYTFEVEKSKTLNTQSI